MALRQNVPKAGEMDNGWDSRSASRLATPEVAHLPTAEMPRIRVRVLDNVLGGTLEPPARLNAIARTCSAVTARSTPATAN